MMDFRGCNSDERLPGGGKLNRYRQMRTSNQQNNNPNELPSGNEHLPLATADLTKSGSAIFGAPIVSIGEGQPIFPTALSSDAGTISNSSAIDQHLLVQQLRQEQQHLQQPAGFEQLAQHVALRQQLHQQEQAQQQQLRPLQLLQSHEDRLEEDRDLTEDGKRKTSPEYRMKRAKNNEAVRKSREKKKMENSVTARKLTAVVEENNMLEARVERLKKELVVVKGIFMQQTLGFSPSTADVSGAVNAVGDVTGLGVEGLAAFGGVDDRTSQGPVGLEEVVPASLPEPSASSSSCNLPRSSAEPPSDLSQGL